ncbi:DUF3147 family protein [Aeromonas cavernicola]|uniref:DUF3147 domain-containing protein n=1 Tax=Aeromonas cavernicola TaxID=1006623 RepID=A0A2H9U663_9GAMM|nr:DUF3147 family protein [Aeromonas cavernicola]PJG59546.1 hypothetical protein CUC53_06730 [Aeromonas cavernicola]
MIWLIFKYMITAAMVVLISEVAKRSDKLGGLLAALPIVTLLVLVWMKLEGQHPQKIANHAWYTFWYVVPTLPMFLIFPLLYQRYGFWLALMGCCALTIVLFIMWSKLLSKFGIALM